MKKPVLFLLLLAAYFTSFSQSSQSFQAFSNGELAKETSYVNVEGDPYLFKEWRKADIKMKDGTTFSGVEVRYNVVEDQLLFKNPKGEIMSFKESIPEFTFEGMGGTYVSGVSGAKPFTTNTFFQALNSGKVKVLKKQLKNIVERREYNSASSTRTFVENTNYYILTASGQAIPLKKDKKAILAVLNDKVPQLETYLSQNKLNLKNDADLVALFDYYNSL